MVQFDHPLFVDLALAALGAADNSEILLNGPACNVLPQNTNTTGKALTSGNN